MRLRVLGLERPEVPVRILLDVGAGRAHFAAPECAEPRARGQHHQRARCRARPSPSKIKQALDRNAIVAVLADRGQPQQPHADARISSACRRHFPTSPWLLAAALKVPVMLAFGLYRGGNRYDLHFETFADRIVIERSRRAEALAQILQRFADRLAHYARLAPYNWFNFYDFWQQRPPRRSRGAAVAGAGDLLRRS